MINILDYHFQGEVFRKEVSLMHKIFSQLSDAGFNPIWKTRIVEYLEIPQIFVGESDLTITDKGIEFYDPNTNWIRGFICEQSDIDLIIEYLRDKR